MNAITSDFPVYQLHTDAFARAATLAQSVEGRTSPNPPVGAVVVRDGMVVGMGATQPAGGLHAERIALQAAGHAAQGADLYTTLEPCTFHGRTPPCTDAIIATGIRRVYYVARDPDPRIGCGAAPLLQRADIEVVQLPDPTGTIADALAPFCCRTIAGRPLVTAKYAMTLDGRIATATGDSRWISGAASRRQVHLLRDRVDAIMVGVGTALADDPVLTTRLDDHWRPVRHPLRVIVDSHGRTPLTSRLLDPALPGHTLFATVNPPASWVESVIGHGAEVAHIPPDSTGRVALPSLLRHLASIGTNHLLVEGGGTLLGELAAAQLIDTINAFIAPTLVGGNTAPGPVGDPGVLCIADSHQFTIQRVERHEQDVLLIARATQAPWWDATKGEV